MERILKCYVAPGQPDRGWIAGLLLSLVIPAAILFVCPFGLTLRQSAVVAAVLLVIIWWSAGIVKKNTGVGLFDRGFLPGQQGRSEDDLFRPPVGDISDDCDDLSVQPGDRKFRAD